VIRYEFSLVCAASPVVRCLKMVIADRDSTSSSGKSWEIANRILRMEAVSQNSHLDRISFSFSDECGAGAGWGSPLNL
jgi:hypothetical protein